MTSFQTANEILGNGQNFNKASTESGRHFGVSVIDINKGS